MRKVRYSLLLVLILAGLFFVGCEPTDSGTPQPPQSLQLEVPTEVRVVDYNNQPVVFFNEVENAKEYQITVYKNGKYSSRVTETAGNTALGVLISGLNPGEYELDVKAIADASSNYISSNASARVSFSVSSNNGETSYTVTFNSNGGSLVSSQTVEGGDKASKPVDPTRSGYEFVEWQLNGKTYDFATAVTSNITLVAKWAVVGGENTSYTVTFNSNGGTSVASQSVEAGKTATKPANPTKSGYNFVEWQLNGSAYSFATPVTSNITLVAKWEAVNQTTDYITYYDKAEGLTGSVLKAKLREIISSYSNPTSYDDLRTDLAYTDQDPEDSTKIMQFYTRIAVAAKWDSGATWNREHVWPQSQGWFKESGAGSDIHHIRPTSNNVNSTRGNKLYGEFTGGTAVYDKKTGGLAGYYSGNYFKPLDEVKGDAARIVLYMLVRYSNTDSAYPVTKVFQSMAVLLEWHEADPVDDFERVRNERSYEVQGNRNPFIDYPEFADMIWG